MSKNFKSTKNIIISMMEKRSIFKSEGYILWNLKQNWKKIIGEKIGENSEPIWLKNGKIVINIKDTSIYHPLVTSQNIIMEKVNEFLGENMVSNLEIRKISRNEGKNITDDLVRNEKLRREIFKEDEFYEEIEERRQKEKKIEKIEISSEEIEIIEKSIDKIDSKYSEFSEKLKKIAINRIKKDIYMLSNGYRRCDRCNSIYYPRKDERICFECYEKKETEKRELMTQIIRENPFIGEKKAVNLTKTDEYTYYKVRDILAQRAYYELLYFCEKADMDIEENKDYSEEIRNEAKLELELLIKAYIDYRIGTEDKAVFQNERKRVLRKLKNEIKFRKNK